MQRYKKIFKYTRFYAFYLYKKRLKYTNIQVRMIADKY